MRPEKRIIPMLLTILTLMILLAPVAAEKAQLTPEFAEIESIKFLAMTLSVSICAVAAAYAVARVSVAALAGATEKPEILGRSIILVGLAEGIAIYGLLIAFLIWIT